MKQRLLKALPLHIETLQTCQGISLYVVDWKDENGGGVEIYEEEPQRRFVQIKNPNAIDILFDGFAENALPIKKGQYCSQCECVLFPETANREEWVLFIEMKYARDEFKALDPRNRYPSKMVNQIIKTVDYFREKHILASDKTVNAIVSFPELQHFNAWFANDAVEDALKNHRVIIRAINQATIVDDKNILLIERIDRY